MSRPWPRAIALLLSSIGLSGLVACLDSSANQPGMGAIPHGDSVTFRVWAPFASGVAVASSFNNWSDTATPLTHEDNGYWSAQVSEASVGDEYKYVITNRDSGEVLRRIDPYAREVTNSAGNAVVADLDFSWEEDFSTPPWNEMVIYEMHIGTFNDEPGGPPGDFSSAIKRLDHLRSLGVNAIQVMPAAEFAADFSWGYNPAHPFAIESAYGGPRAFKAFIEAAHQRGIAVIFDVVYNHLGPDDLDLWRFDGWSENGGGGIYFYNDWRSRTPWGDTRPDYGRPEVRQYLRDNALLWLDEFRVDGLRWDSTVNIRTVSGEGDLPDGWSLMRWVNDEINARFPEKISIAEDLQNNAWITKDTEADGAGFDAQWSSAFVHPIRDAVIAAADEQRDMAAVRDAISHRYNTDAFERVIYTESHDEVANGRQRVPEEISPEDPGSWFARKRSTLGAAIALTAPGIPMIFQGQEMLEDEWFHDQDPIDWSKLDTYRGIYTLYRDLIRLRRNWDNQTAGLRGQHVNVHHVNNQDKLIAYHRWADGGPGDDVVVVANFADRTHDAYAIGFPNGGQWRVRFNSDARAYGEDFGAQGGYDVTAYSGSQDGMGHRGEVGIAPYSVLILSQD
ncbi:MAG: alpha-amylase family glycosyl hydrolase [Elainellaceae cyanobacterium]